jgi:cell wall-associated NlpC family hydrolase
MTAMRVADQAGGLTAKVTDDGWAILAEPPGARDLGQPEFCALSQERSRRRRELAAARAVQVPKTTTGKVSAALVTATLMAPVAETGVAAAQGTPSAQVASSSGLLRRGSNGAGVASVQRALGIPADGVFGPGTARAVRSYQAAHGLEVDGVVGPVTSGSLGLSGGAPGVVGRGGKPSASVTRMIQGKLGLAADGVFGPRTRAAVKAFQAGHGLVADGVVGPRTLAAMAGPAPSGSGGSARGPKPSPAVTTAIQGKLGLAADGVFGPATKAAVKAFQAGHGLEVDGVVGPATLAALGVAGSAPASGGGSGTSQGGSSAVAAAQSMIGVPYATAGTTPAGFDCSGLTQWAFRQAGISLPRTSYAQFGVGAPVSRANIQAGDLVFFNTSGAGASHVGIATSNSTVISATTHGVMQHAISDSYWGSHYVGARRV